MERKNKLIQEHNKIVEKIEQLNERAFEIEKELLIIGG
jgi:hypothetical protein